MFILLSFDITQSRIPTVSTNIKPALLGAARPGPGPSIRPLTSGGGGGPRPGASITMIQPGQKLVVPATVGQIITGN